VPTLELPAAGQPAGEQARCEAARLFARRASAVEPGFAATPENAPVIVEICRKLDGLPLAIELAAARVKLYPMTAMLELLEHRLRLLTDGHSPPRYRVQGPLANFPEFARAFSCPADAKALRAEGERVILW
jgi:non-specific serine/threonine protein kinase